MQVVGLKSKDPIGEKVKYRVRIVSWTFLNRGSHWRLGISAARATCSKCTLADLEQTLWMILQLTSSLMGLSLES